MDRTLSVTVAMPVYNEQATLEEIVRRVLAIDRTLEIVLVDDASTDGSREILARLEQHPAIRVFYQEQNMGKGAAVRRAFTEARNDIVIVQDADLEYDPNDYYALLRPLELGRADVVYGSRYMHRERKALRYRHSLGNRFLTFLSNLFTDLYITDMETCYKAFRREVIQNIELSSDRFGIEPEITAKIARLGLSVYEVPIAYHGRSYGDGKKINWRDGVSALWQIVRFNWGAPPKLLNEDEFRRALVDSGLVDGEASSAGGARIPHPGKPDSGIPGARTAPEHVAGAALDALAATPVPSVEREDDHLVH